MDLSVVIVSYRTPDHLRGCLESLAADPTRRSREIVVVDNDSGDESPDVARAFDGVRVIETGENSGFAGGVNRGLRESTGRYVVVLNPDIRVDPGALDTLVDYLEEHPRTGLVGPRLRNTDGSLQYSCRRFYTLRTILLRRTFLGKLFPEAGELRRHLMLDYDHAEPRPVDWVVGAAMMVRRDAVADVGPMDERYFLYFEDVDWCTRMQARGWSVDYVPAAEMVHDLQRASARSGRAARIHLRSGIRFWERWSGFLYVVRQYRATLRRIALAVLDAVAVVLAFLVAYEARRQLAFVLDKPVWTLGFYTGFISAAVLVFLAAFAASGLYRRVKEGDWIDVAFRAARGATLGALVVMAATFLLEMRGFSRAMVLAVWPLAAVGAFAVRRLVYALGTRARRGQLDRHRIALLGADPVLDRLARSLAADGSYEPVRLPEAGDPETWVARLAAERVTEVVVSPDVLTGDAAAGLHRLRGAGLEVRITSGLLSQLPPRARLESVGDQSWLTLARPALGPAGSSKRLLDIVLALLLGLLGAVPALVWASVRAISGRPLREPEAVWRGRWGETVRVRRLAGGGWLRNVTLLGAVLAGRVSLVGPRPLAPGEAVPGGAAWERVREGHRPGLIGPWSLAPSANLEEEAQQELRYLEEWTPELDMKLLARAALPRRGPGGGDDSPLRVDRRASADPSSAPAVPPRGAMEADPC